MKITHSNTEEPKKEGEGEGTKTTVETPGTKTTVENPTPPPAKPAGE